jgi:hypothetical protein
MKKLILDASCAMATLDVAMAANSEHNNNRFVLFIESPLIGQLDREAAASRVD